MHDMPKKSFISKGDYRDSVFLMRVNQECQKLDGVKACAVMMGTDANKDIAKDAWLYTDELANAGPNDIFIVIDAIDEAKCETALAKAKDLLNEVERGESAEEMSYRTLRTAIENEPDSNLVLISTPGEYAFTEALTALNNDKNVMIFSSDVPIDDELKLKQLGSKKGLLVMGPDCGTAIINGIGLGFSNIVKKGPIGIVGAAGTGIQEVTSLLDDVGISQAIGTGSHDLSEKIGGITMIDGIRMLGEDQETKVLVVISKPPSPAVTGKILEYLRKVGKPAVVNFIGGNVSDEGNIIGALTLEDAAKKALAIITGAQPSATIFSKPMEELEALITQETKRLSDKQKYVRGLFSGGTLCAEAQVLFRNMSRPVRSNVPLEKDLLIQASARGVGDTFIDMGTEEFVRGIPHPMIDFRFRNERIIRESQEDDVAVILLDIVLGLGANINPAGELADAVAKARVNGKSIIASVCGTERDPQSLHLQVSALERLGVIILPSNAQAARLAALVASRGGAWGYLK
jgi:FdrA protein